MMQPYREIFKISGSFAFISSAFIGRMPLSMAGLGIITMLSQFHGEYAIAGAVAAIFSLSMALLGPQVSRLVDRHGQGKVLPIAAFISASSMLALLLLARMDAPVWTLFLFAALSGCMPSMSAMVRARWTPLLHGSPHLKTAYALESVLDEVSFIVGPPISIGMSVTLFPEAGLLTALILQIIGVGAFSLQSQTEPTVKMQTSSHAQSPLRIPAIKILLLLLLSMGVIVGTIDVVSVAFANALQQPAAASVVLSSYALGACLAGLYFGALNLNVSLARLLSVFGIATSLSTVPLLFVPDIAYLAIAMFVSGLFFAPTMIVAMSLVESIVPSAKLTEGLTWMISGLGVGMAIGAGASGQVVDWFGIRGGFSVALIAGAAALFSVTLSHYHLRASR